jgi:aminopeptidase Y
MCHQDDNAVLIHDRRREGGRPTASVRAATERPQWEEEVHDATSAVGRRPAGRARFAERSFGAGGLQLEAYRQKVTVANMLVHERALQRFADANGGTRAAGTPGNTATTDYVLKTMRAAGWKTQLQPFEFPFFQETAPATFEQTTPTPATFTEDVDSDTGYALMTYSDSGDVTGTLVPVDVTVPMDPAAPASTSNSGCEAADFAGFRRAPSRSSSAARARSTTRPGTPRPPARARWSYSTKDSPGEVSLLQGTLTAPGDGVQPIGIPVVGVSYQFGVNAVTAIRGGATVTWHLATQTISETARRTT